MPNSLPSWEEYYAGLAKHVASACVLIENERGELLVLKANYKKNWSPPGGVIDAGETPVQAALRETNEESGIELEPTDLKHEAMIVRIGPDEITYLFVFSASQIMNTSEQIILDKSEIDEYDWVSKEDVKTGKNGRSYNHAIRNWASDEPLSYLEAVL